MRIRSAIAGLATAALSCSLLTCASSASAQTTRQVPSQYPTISAAITAAVAGDTINVAAGTYKEHLVATKKLTLQGAGQGICTVDGTLNGVCLDMTYGTVNGFTFANGVSGDNLTQGAGGIYVRMNAAISDCTIINAFGTYGGGLSTATNSTVTVINCSFLHDTSYYGGGGIFNASSLKATNCVFVGCVSKNGQGGALLSQKSAAVGNCTFAKNVGGGVFYLGTADSINNCILWGDTGGQGEFYGKDYGAGGSWYPVNPVSCSMGIDPKFVRNPFTNGPTDYGDLHLQAGSPCIGKGAQL